MVVAFARPFGFFVPFVGQKGKHFGTSKTATTLLHIKEWPNFAATKHIAVCSKIELFLCVQATAAFPVSLFVAGFSLLRPHAWHHPSFSSREATKQPIKSLLLLTLR